MAKVHLLPLPHVTGRDIQTETTLLRAIESGVDLGARGHHIQALGLALESTSRMLQQATAALPTGSGPQAAEWQGIQADIAQLTRTVERLTHLCQTLSA